MNSKDPDLEILGQKINYPSSWHSSIFMIITVLTISLTICGVTYFTLVGADPRNTEQVVNFLSGTLSHNDQSVSENNDLLIKFWTPSPKTWEDLSQLYDEMELERHKWQKVDEEKVQEFAESLKGKGYSSGWRRYETYSQGATEAKSGYWWTMTASQGFDLGKFKIYYLEFWDNPDLFYVEIHGATSKYTN